ncbi:kinesin light chain 3 [Phaeosphaeriaceae sp. PMI808]|nr:kinesin light chain 3 [Phaeosphaeriaceae sp. PMI808]
MRLLHIDQSERLVSTNFSGTTIPPYAILSHRWGDSEVLFEDLGTDSYKDKDGYRKIEICAQQAAQDQLQYFWIDTCCIDKWNIRERSKSINSMFRWYKDASKCYVILPDVSVPAATEIPQQSDWEASFRASDWFNRGWTLQELIAPVVVEFFSSEGRLLGDKRSLERLIHEITSIPIDALQNCPLDKFTISDRKKWAEIRNTTEEEDSVYCLLGILDVFMPTEYGEGKEKAWRRLQAETEVTGVAPSIIPYSQNDHFVGRESQLAELKAKLFGEEQTTMLAITGPGGTGKSQLALELAYQTKQNNKRCSVFWVDASDIDSLHRSYASITQKLDIPGWRDENANAKQLVKLHLSREAIGQWLLIFDNTNDINLPPGGPSTANLIDYLPQSTLGSIIFTTTNGKIAKRLASQNIIELGEMTPDAAQRMLENYLEAPLSGSELQEAKPLLQELSYLPIAIIQAAAYINTSNVTLRFYQSLLIKKKEEIFEYSSELSESKPHERVAKGPVDATLLISVDEIQRNSSLAADHLFLAACVNRKDIPLYFLKASSPFKTEDTMKVLSSYALITRRPADSTFDLHQLVHRALRGWLQKQGMLGPWTQNAITALRWAFPDNEHGSRSKWRRLLPHAKFALSHSLTELESEDRMTLMWKYANVLSIDGCYSESEELYVQLVEIEKRILGEEHPDTLTNMNNLAFLILEQGRWKEAEELQAQVLEISKRILGEEHPNTLTSMNNLALSISEQGRWKEAEELQAQVLEISKRILGEEHPDTLTSMDNLALSILTQGRWKEAKELQAQVLEISKRILGEEHPDTLTSMDNLAESISKQGRRKEAEELQAQVLERRKKILGEEHPDTLTSKNNLALSILTQGRWKEAKELQAQVLEISKRILGEEHPNTLTSMNNLALSISEQGRWKEAEELQAQVLERRKKILGEEHPDTLTSMDNLAESISKQGRRKEAEELQAQVLERRKKILGEEHPDTLTSINNLALLILTQGRWKEAEQLQAQVLEISKRILGEEHPNTLTSMNNLALSISEQGRWKEAEELQAQVLERRKKILGEEHPDTLTSMDNLAESISEQGRWKEAEELQAQVLGISKRILGEEHPSTLTIMNSLAIAFDRQDRNKEAISLMERCVELRKRALGPQHPNTQGSLKALNYWVSGNENI